MHPRLTHSVTWVFLLLGILVIEVLAPVPTAGGSFDDGIPTGDISSSDDLTKEVNTSFIVRSALAKAASRSSTNKADSQGEAKQGVIEIQPGAKVRGPIVLQADITNSIAIAKKR
jgi:hypothetical protein